MNEVVSVVSLVTNEFGVCIMVGATKTLNVDNTSFWLALSLRFSHV